MRNGMAKAIRITIPPSVGVPALVWWPLGPSSRMFCPNSRRRTNSMNFGDRNRQMRSAAVPAIKMRPETEPISPLASCAVAAVSQGSAYELETDPARALDEDHVAAVQELRDHHGRLRGA